MRVMMVAAMLTLFCPVAAMAQSTPPAAAAKAAAAATTAPRRGGDITRDQYIERAKENAAKRFDRMDSDHDGVLTEAERHAYRDAHRRVRNAASH
jgi:hypothetical protein